MILYLGVWQNRQARIAPQFMFSLRRLKERKSPAPFQGYDWIMDSGAFSEININGHYTYTPEEYLKYVEMHQPSRFFNMDYMCEPFVLAKTGLTVKEHQARTIENQIKIMDLLNKYDITGEFCGCIQGWKIDQYLEHIDALKAHGLITPKMGVGSVCRRNSKAQIVEVLNAVKTELPCVKLHGFGVKTDILKEPLIYDCLDTCDSMAWSFDGRRIEKKPCLDCQHHCKNCANCHVYMMKWYDRLREVHDMTIKQKTLRTYELGVAIN